MKSEDIKKLLEPIKLQVSNISDPSQRDSFSVLLNLVEYMFAENEKLRKENQQLKDEINRLKGEQGKPDIKGNNNRNNNSSSEKDRKKREPKRCGKRETKKADLTIHKTTPCPAAKSELPADAVFKGYTDVIMQDIFIEAVNIKFKREVYYSPSEKKTYSGRLPDGWTGDYSPNVKALVLSLYHDSRLTIPSIASFLNTHGVLISEAAVSNLITKEFYDVFCREKLEIVNAGLKSSPHQHTDDTGSRVNGVSCHTHILCNEFYTAYFTEKKKDRLTVVKILGGGKLTFILNETAFQIMGELNISNKWLRRLQNSNITGELTSEQFEEKLFKIFEGKENRPNVQKRIKEACAIAAYRRNIDKIPVLVCDDAPQFKLITEELALCWIHEGRHYNKLSPVYSGHRELLDSFIDKFWNFYTELKNYKENPNSHLKESMLEKFDNLFTMKTGYSDLDERIAKTLSKKIELLPVLEKPYLPLHNNPAEHEVRVEKRKQDISFQTRTDAGTKVKDAGMTIVQTAKKLGVNCYYYILDRISGAFKMTSLAKLIEINST